MSNQQVSATFIVPELDSGSSQHFTPYIELINEIGKRFKVFVISESGNGCGNYEFISKIFKCDRRNKIYRAISLIRNLEACRKDGSKVFIVRISKFAGLIVGIWARIFHLKMFIWHSGAIEYSPTKGLKELKDYLSSYLPYCVILKLANKLLTGPKTMQQFYRVQYGIDESKIHILDNNVDTKRFQKVTSEQKHHLRQKYGLNNELVISLVHRLSPIRRHLHYFPKIFEVIAENNVVFLIVGDGPESTEIKSLIQRRNLSHKIRMIGKVAHDRVNEVLQLSDIFINPSYVEGFPRVVIEAMSCGLPVLATNAGGTIDLFPPDYKTLVVDRDDPLLLSKKLENLITVSEAERLEIGSALQNWSMQYANSGVAEQYIALFTQELGLSQ